MLTWCLLDCFLEHSLRVVSLIGNNYAADFKVTKCYFFHSSDNYRKKKASKDKKRNRESMLSRTYALVAAVCLGGSSVWTRGKISVAAASEQTYVCLYILSISHEHSLPIRSVYCEWHKSCMCWTTIQTKPRTYSLLIKSTPAWSHNEWNRFRYFYFYILTQQHSLHVSHMSV